MNQETGNYETFHRQYDAAIGRFTAVDIMASSFSNQTPYQYANNDPVYFNDPLGDYGRGGSIYDEMKDRMGHKSTGPANDGFSGYFYGESFADGFNARMAYRNDVLGWAQAGYADAHQEYAQMYGATIDPRIIDYYTNGIATEENYIDTEYIYDLGEGDQNGGTDPKEPMYFEGVRVYDSKMGDLEHGAAFTLPGRGIYVSLDYYKDNPKKLNDLLRHEYGHVLQAERYGYVSFYLVIASVSVGSTQVAPSHQHTWTEMEANTLSYLHFNMPEDWNFNRYPIDQDYLGDVIKNNHFDKYGY
ncbi:hypothetical protein LVD17_27190 [Fulvivirga ulvae]|uniref:RHS repeat-associated core domain-containing protein n=1 Tax=Fulvivirga ulvae TaxID=2904245 RepID=UPI001F208029|nr:RHS repeat-associated core domain-containing protein [Fulvivirga ulvae]UII31977.1 hypothetical protein LVD17_27190 [Fulvivirga ulvae]